MESLSKQADFAAQYRFMEAQEADKIFTQLIDPEVPFSVKPVSNDTIPTADTTVSLFNTPRPDILIVILESFLNWRRQHPGETAPETVPPQSAQE